MRRRPYLFDGMHPFMQLLLLITFSLICMAGFYKLGMLLVNPLFGITNLDVVTDAALSNPDAVALNAAQVNSLKFLQFMASLGGFLLPAVLFAGLKFPEGDYLKLKTALPVSMVLLGILILVASGPFIDSIYYLNRNLKLPASLAAAEQLIRTAEEAAEKLTLLFLKTPRPTDLWINLIVISIIPAVGEELFFRGCVQQLMKEWTKNSHRAIWIAAFIFSFIHFQFYGFVPRMLLGALLGYLFLWSGSLWVPIIAHAFNNAAQVILVYLNDHGILQYDIRETELLPLYITVISSLVCVGGIWLFRRMVIHRRFIY